MKFDVLCLFPSYFKAALKSGVLGRACLRGILNIRLLNIRDFSVDKHSKVDDRPYGGGPGMVLMAEPICRAIESVKGECSHVIYLSPQGKVLNAAKCQELSQYEHLILICGQYEGIDERVLDREVDEEISIGNYVLTNGAPAALVLMDSISRFVPGVLGNEAAAEEDSFQGDGLLEAPQYTRPRIFKGISVPGVLMSGNHLEIKKWRHAKALDKTQRVHPELIQGVHTFQTSDKEYIMKLTKEMQETEMEFLKKDLPPFRTGDTLCIHNRIIEGGKERIQLFTGTLIAKRGRGLSTTITLCRASYGSVIERVFLPHSPRIAKIVVVKRGKVRKSKLYRLRGATGKAAKVKELII